MERYGIATTKFQMCASDQLQVFTYWEGSADKLRLRLIVKERALFSEIIELREAYFHERSHGSMRTLWQPVHKPSLLEPSKMPVV